MKRRSLVPAITQWQNQLGIYRSVSEWFLEFDHIYRVLGVSISVPGLQFPVNPVTFFSFIAFFLPSSAETGVKQDWEKSVLSAIC